MACSDRWSHSQRQKKALIHGFVAADGATAEDKKKGKNIVFLDSNE